ncbi:MAG: extracellular solute-binding protein [Desulfovibrionales bacterium]|nr:extracellular solute-binding protein [Desulfovibrionales bacterium]
MKNKQILIVSLLFAFLLLPVFANGTQDTASATGAKKHLTVWHAYAGQADKEEFINFAMNDFKAKYPDIEIEEVPMEHSAYKMKLNTAMATGNPPDVFYTLPGAYLEAFVDGGQVYSLNEAMAANAYSWEDKMLTSALDRVTINDNIYAVPIDIDAAVMWYNKKMFEEHNWIIPRTYGEFITLCLEIKSEGIIPIALGNKDRWPATFWFQYPMMRLIESGIVDSYNAGDPIAHFSKDGVKGFEVIEELAKIEAFPMGVNGMSTSEANMLFLNGQAAMVLNGTWQIGMSADGPDNFELGYFPFMRFTDGKADQSDVIAGVAACFAISEQAQDKESALLFLQHMSSLEIAAKYVEIRKTMVTTKGAINSKNAGEILFSISNDVVEKAATLDAFYDTAMPPAAVETYYSILQSILDLQMEPQEAAQQLEQSMQSN